MPDLVVFGATGFVGRLVAERLAATAPAGLDLALAGRSLDRLAEVRDALPGERTWSLIQADSTDPASLAALAASSRVVATTVGPYARHGLPLVEACARAGTHYADLTGEVLFVRQAIDASADLARRSGARIVHACGFDSVPSDLSVRALAERAAADGAGGLTDTRLVARLKGGFSGGTIDSMRAQLDAVRSDPAARRTVGDPYALSPDRSAEPTTRQPTDTRGPSRTPDGAWAAPFVMASFNTRVVRRSNALLDWAYGRSLAYGEVQHTGRGPAGALGAAGLTAGLAAFVAATALPPTRRLLDRVLPAPGSGPSREAREQGFFEMVTTASTTSGRRYRAVAAAPGDPGYAATAVMLAEATLALVTDDLPSEGGSLTPATAFGSRLADRLRAAGHTYTVTEV